MAIAMPATQAAESTRGAGVARLLSLSAAQESDGEWWLDVEYEFAGTPLDTEFKLDLLPHPVTPFAGFAESSGAYLYQVKAGRNHEHVPLQHPGFEATTYTIQLSIVSQDGRVIATKSIRQQIHWQDYGKYLRARMRAGQNPQEQLASTVQLIDIGGDEALQEARSVLQTLILANPRMDAAFIELARVAMKLNWSDEGLRQAEQYLKTARSIAPANPNAQILMGYVYTHQKRFAEAESQFTQAARSNPPNLWLWFNWGELLAAQGRVDPAIARYRQATAAPRSRESYDKAREAAYLNLLNILTDKGDLDGIEAIHKQRLADYGPNICFGRLYALFLVQQRGNPDAAIEEARKNGNAECRMTADQNLMGLAHYLKWVRAQGEARTQALNLARTFMPISADAFYQLARSDATAAALRPLVREGESIDLLNAEQQSALGLAVSAADYAAARRLIEAGANINLQVGVEHIPIGMLPVLSADPQGVRALRKLGVSYKSMKYQGISALEIARQLGGPDLVQAMNGSDNRL